MVSAPRDGSVILARVNSVARQFILISWRKDSWLTEYCGVYRDEDILGWWKLPE
jgi:hypothetical protein